MRRLAAIQRWTGLLAIHVAAVGAAAGPVLTPRDVARLQSVVSAAISPDGRTIAYRSAVPRDPYAPVPGGGMFEDGPAWTELHVITVADGKSRAFVTGPVNVGDVRWTPDSRGICFVQKRDGDKKKCLYMIPVDGGEARRLLAHDTDIGEFDLSADGRRVAFVAAEKPDPAKERLEEMGFAAEVYEEDFEPARAWIAGVGPGAEAPRMLELAGSVAEVRWLPDGKRLLAVTSPTPLIDDQYMKKNVVIVNVDDGREIARFGNHGKLGPVELSHDGRYVAMVSAEDENDPSEGRLFVTSVATGKWRDVLPDYLGHVSRIAWQDENTVMYLGDEGVGAAFGKVDINGTAQKTIFKSDEVVLRGLSISRDGMHGTFVGSAAAHPGEVFVMNHGDATPRRLTFTNPWLEDLRLADQEPVTYRARDGLELQGILIHPLHKREGTRVPLIISVHGGPESHEANGWLTTYSRPGQVAAARGFAVFYPNYRGSTGRGVAFSKLGQGDEAGKEFDDIVDAIDYLEAAGLIDEKRVGITGGSYGGYAAAWGATAQSKHFAASVMFVGISDSISKKGTTDIPNEDYLVHTRGRPWEDKWRFYLERSPIYHVKAARTPILILGGANDTRVHPGQSMELYRFLKTIGQAPVRLVRYPGEGHGNRKASSRLDYHLRMLRWFEHYLKGPGGPPPPFELDYGLDGEAPAATQPTGAQG